MAAWPELKRNEQNDTHALVQPTYGSRPQAYLKLSTVSKRAIFPLGCTVHAMPESL